MSRCYFLEDKLLRSSTKKLFVGGINIRNISTKPWSNLNEERVQQFSNFCLIRLKNSAHLGGCPRSAEFCISYSASVNNCSLIISLLS